jgi:plasmid stability protein
MGSISVRKLDDQVIEKLRLRAVAHKVSMEEEVRTILERAVSAPNQITSIFLKYFGPKNGLTPEEIEIINAAKDRTPHEPMSFDE